MLNISTRVRAVREALGLTQADMAERMIFSRNYISMVERGTNEPGKRFMQELALLEAQVNAKKLAGTTEQPAVYRASGDKRSNVAPTNSRGRVERQIPILSYAQAGVATDYEELPREWDDTVGYDGTDKKAFALRIEGDSMSPQFPAGTIITVGPSNPPHNGNLVVARLKGEGVLFKLFHHSGDNRIVTLTSFNPAYPEIRVGREKLHWLWKVVQATQRFS